MRFYEYADRYGDNRKIQKPGTQRHPHTTAIVHSQTVILAAKKKYGQRRLFGCVRECSELQAMKTQYFICGRHRKQ